MSNTPSMSKLIDTATVLSTDSQRKKSACWLTQIIRRLIISHPPFISFGADKAKPR